MMYHDLYMNEFDILYPEVAQTFSTTIGPTISDTDRMTDEMKLRKRASYSDES